MAYTLADYSAGTTNPLIRGVLNVILDDNNTHGQGILNVMPIESSPDNALSWAVTKLNTEGTASMIGFRALNQGFPEGTIPTYQETFNMSFVGGDISYDLAFDYAKNYVAGAAPGVLQAKAKVELINRLVNYVVYAGDRAIDPNQFNGVNKWVDSTQILLVTDLGGSYTNGLDVGPNFTTANAKYLIFLLDQLIDMVPGDAEQLVFLMNWRMKGAFVRSLRESGFMQITKDQFGRTFDSYRGIKIINPGSRTAVETLIPGTNNANAVLPNNVSFGSATTSSPITLMRLGSDDGCALYEQKPLDARVVAEEDFRAPQKIMRVDWHLTFIPMQKNSIAQLRGVLAA